MDERAKKLADLFGGYIDEPNREKYSNPTYTGDPDYNVFRRKLEEIMPEFKGNDYNPQQFGETQNPPQYRGIRLLLPGSGGEYSALKEGKVPGSEGVFQEMMGHLITRGYPVLGGTGQFPGREKGFNPVGFGQK